jgi:branched-chain amino acid transport system substrate-binding protein
MKFGTRLITAGAIATLLASVGFGRAVGLAADPVEVPVVISQTGQGAFLGAQLRQGMELAEALTNKTGGIGGRPLKLVFYDDQTNPQVAIQLFNGFAAKHASVVLGPAFTAPCLAAAQIVHEQRTGGAVLVTGVASRPRLVPVQHDPGCQRLHRGHGAVFPSPRLESHRSHHLGRRHRPRRRTRTSPPY